MSEKRDRDPFDNRYLPEDAESSETEESAETAETTERSKPSKMSEAAKTTETEETSESAETSKESVRERKNVNMYLPDDLVSELQLRYSELNVEWRRRHDEDLPKNDQFYPAVIRSALEETSIEEELDLADSVGQRL